VARFVYLEKVLRDPVATVIRWLITAVAVWVAAELVAGISYRGTESILVVAAILGLLNLYVRPVLSLLALPITIVTLGLFLIVINAVLLGLAAWLSDLFGVDFTIDDVWSALLGALIISLVSLVIGLFVDAEGVSRRLTGRGF
jgi:putative membrane protein